MRLGISGSALPATIHRLFRCEEDRWHINDFVGGFFSSFGRLLQPLNHRVSIELTCYGIYTYNRRPPQCLIVGYILLLHPAQIHGTSFEGTFVWKGRRKEQYLVNIGTCIVVFF